MKPRLLALLAVVVVPLAGCGGGGGGSSTGSADPAKLAPASAPLYVDVTLRPQGSKADDAKAAAQKLLQTNDPGAKAQALVDKALADSGIGWKDLQPWLGERVGIFVTSFASGHTVAAAVFDAKDTGKAKDTIAKGLAHRSSGEKPPKVQNQTYKGVSYSVDTANDNAGGIVDGYAVIGTIAGFKQAVDTAKGGRALTSVGDFTAGRSAVGADGALAHAWANPQALLDAISKTQTATPAMPLIRQVFAQFGRAVAVSLTANGDAVRLDAAAIGTQQSGSGHSGADVAAGLPSDAWLAIGIADLGPTVRRALAQIEQVGQLGNVDVGGIMRQFQSSTGLSISHDLLSWMGDGAFYARGQSINDLGAVFTVTSTNPAGSRHAVVKLARAFRKFGLSVQPTHILGYTDAIQARLAAVPIPFYVAGSNERLSIGVNPQALADVAKPSQKLGDAPAFAAGSKALGSGFRPSVLIDLPTVVQLLEGLGLGSNPSYQKAKPYLNALGVIAAGAQRSGDTYRLRLAVALK